MLRIVILLLVLLCCLGPLRGFGGLNVDRLMTKRVIVKGGMRNVGGARIVGDGGDVFSGRWVVVG